MNNFFKELFHHNVDGEDIYSPFEGIVYPINLIPNSIISNDIIGVSYAVIPLNNIVRAPCDCSVKDISKVCNALSLKADKFELIVNVGLNPSFYSERFFDVLVKKGQHLERGDDMMTFAMEALKQIDSNFVCILTVKIENTTGLTLFSNLKKVDTSNVIFRFGE